MALCFAFVCQTAFAVSFSREEYRQIVFEAIGGASDTSGKLCDNLWLGTVEAPRLGTAYRIRLWMFMKERHRASFTSTVTRPILRIRESWPFSPAAACVLPQGNWSIRFQSGRPVLMLNGSDKAKIEGVKINSFPFSIPVVDQYGDPVAGAVFDLQTVTWGGNDEMSLGTVTTGADGILRFPGMLQADGAYWFKQISAAEGLRAMQEESVALERDLDKGVISAMTDTEHPNEVRLSRVINRRR